MRSQFPGMFPATPDELKAFWQSAVLSFDANILLNVYRVKTQTADNFITLLERLTDQIWLTHQASYEFLKNRETVIIDSSMAYEKSKKEMTDLASEVRRKLKTISRHTLIDATSIADEFSSKLSGYADELIALKEKHPNFLRSDPYLEKISSLFSSKVGNALNKPPMDQVYKEGERRYKAKIPPGYEDKKKGAYEQYGDYIIWLQLIDKCKTEKKNLVFITDDDKEDWWNEIKGQKRGPRPELLREFFDETNHSIRMYTMDRFMEHAARIYEVKIDEASIQEAKDVRKETRRKLNSQKKMDLLRKIKLRSAQPRGISRPVSIERLRELEEGLSRQKQIEQALLRLALQDHSNNSYSSSEEVLDESPQLEELIDEDGDDQENGEGDDPKS